MKGPPIMSEPQTNPRLTPNNPLPVDATDGGDLETQTVSERVEASVTGEDRPMEKQYPTAPGALVWFTFPAILIVLLLLGLLFVGFWPST
jgi:hypothetical protein